MNILFYTPLNIRSRDIESQAAEFSRRGHKIFLLTLTPRGVLHENFETYGYHVAAANSSSRFVYITLTRRILQLRSYCRRNKIDIVYSHLEPANFVAVLAQYLVSARVIICRHHQDYARLAGFSNDLSYRLTYKLAKDIIVVSRQTRDYMIREEGVTPEKIHVIELSYDFALYGNANESVVGDLKVRFPCQILLITVGRLKAFKRQNICIEIVDSLTRSGIDVKLLILGEGEARPQLSHIVDSLHLNDRVFFCGYVENVLDYLSAADILLHPSVSESSCITVKEAGLMKLAPIVCDGVGDFTEYLKEGENGFMVSTDQFATDAARIISTFPSNRRAFELMGSKLRSTILERFDIQHVAPYYESVFHQPHKKR